MEARSRAPDGARLPYFFQIFGEGPEVKAPDHEDR
jgi:hypothetical protein